MKRLALGFVLTSALLAAALSPLAAADAGSQHVVASHRVKQAAPPRVPLALRTLSRRSAAVIAGTPCWHGCTSQCGWNFQGCLRVDALDLCMADNNQCELACLRQCRFLGGPLVSWTDYWR